MIPDFDTLTLSGDQAKSYSRLEQFIHEPFDPWDPTRKGQFITLKGHAGTGKSLLVTLLVHREGGKKPFALTAPTNKATKVLDRMAWESHAPVADVRTIYSLMGLKLTSDGELKEIRSSGGGTVAEFSIVVVDEASMINSELNRHIMSSLPAHVKMIRVGDPLQLPPVGEDMSPVFADGGEVLEMTQVVRQAENNPIIALAQHLRQCILAGDRSMLKIKTNRVGNEGVIVLPDAKFKAWMRQGFKTQQYKNDGDSFRSVAWRNVTVDEYNRGIRKAIYGDDLDMAKPFMVGERVLAAEPVQVFEAGMQLEDNADIIMKTDDEGIVLGVDEMIHPYIPKQYGDYKVWRCEIGGMEEGSIDTFLIHPDDERKYKQKLDDLRKRAQKERRLWRSFWAFKERFHDLRPAHALTSHRSQGSTYEVCFVDARDIFANRNVVESLKSLYVACTRASKTLCITGL